MQEAGNEVLLFKTKTCPNCRIAGALLTKAGVPYREVDAEQEVELTNKYGVMQAPTVVLTSADGNALNQYRGVSDIKGWLEKVG